MDLLVANKDQPSNIQQMTLEVFGMNGGEDQWDVLGRSTDADWDDRLASLTTTVAPTKKNYDELIKNAASAAGIVVGNSHVLTEAGKLEAVAVVNQAQQQLNNLVIDSGDGAGSGDDLQAQLLANAGKGDIQTMSLDQLNAPANTLTGNSQMHGDGSPQQAQRVRDMESQPQQEQPVINGNVPPVTSTPEEQKAAEKPAPKKRAPRSDAGVPKGKKETTPKEPAQQETSPPTETTQQTAEGSTEANPE